MPLDNKVLVVVTITEFAFGFDFGNNRFIKKPFLFYFVFCPAKRYSWAMAIIQV